MAEKEKNTDFEMAYRREKEVRKETERILKQKAQQLYKTNKALNDLNKLLEDKLEERLIEIQYTEQRFENFIENANDMIYRTDVSGNFTYMNPFGMKFVEFEPKEILGCHFSKFIVNPSQDEIAEFYFNQFSNRKETTYYEFQVKTKSGKLKWLGQNVQIVFEKGTDRIAGFLAIARDITQRVETNTKLALSEEKYRGLFEKMNDGLLFSSPEGRIEIVNPSFCKMLGYTDKELVGKIGYDVLHTPEEAAELRLNTKKRIKGISEEYETSFLHKDGYKIWTRNVAYPHYDENGNFKGVMSIITDISEKKKIEKEKELAYEQLRQSEEKYRGLLENLELGVIELDENNIVTHVFDGFTNLSAYSREELIGQDIIELLTHKDSVDQANIHTQRRLNGESTVYEAQIVKKTGEIASTIISGAPYYDSDGNITGSICILLDISKRKRMEDDMIAAKEKAMEIAKYKELFLANMSHEIRTPLNGVIGLSQLLAKTELNDIQSEYISTIKQSASNLLGLVGDILDLSKIGAGQLELEKTDFDLVETIQNVKNSFEFQAYSKGVSLTYNVKGDFAEQYESDSLRISQVLTNLINNALKFTEEGRVDINLTCVKSKQSQDSILFEVVDSGIGISAEAQGKIFDEFVQAEESTSRKYGGTGLGLNISQKIVNLLGGELKVKSEVGVGSKFYFQIDLEKGKAKGVEDKEDVRNMDWSSLKILLAEDNKVNQFVATGFIESWGGKVTICENGQEVIDILQNETFDIVLMDIQMPIMDGLNATAIIRNELQLNLPIIALTANAVKGDKEKFLSAGMNGYVSKPFDEKVLKNTIIECVDAKVQPLKELPPKVVKKETRRSSTYMDLTTLEKLAGNNPAMIDQLLQTFVDELKIEMPKFDAEDAEEIARLAHKIKPSINYVGAKNLFSQVQKIERKEFEKDPKLLESFKKDLSILLKEVESYLYHKKTA